MLKFNIYKIIFGIEFPNDNQKQLMDKIQCLRQEDIETIEQGNHGLNTVEIKNLLTQLEETKNSTCIVCGE